VNAAPHFDVYACALDGTNLIEASAGTGKTWTLCGLYLRLLLERGLQVQQILVVTFTKAATAELRERIRSRIAETLAFVRDGAALGADPFVPRFVGVLRAQRGLADREIAARLELALRTFDEASIFTIHGFCQRALADAPFASQMPLTLDVLTDDGEFVQQAANDFWRRRIAGDTLDPALAAFLVQRKDSPERFAALLRRHLEKPLACVRWPAAAPEAGATAGEATAAFAAAHDAARAIWHTGRDAALQCLQAGASQLSQVSYKPEAIAAAAQEWDALLATGDALAALEDEPDKTALFGAAKLSAATKKNCSTPAHPFFATAQQWLDRREQSLTLLARARLALLRELIAEGTAEVRSAKRARRVVAYDDMLANLHDRLTSGAAPALAGALRERFPAALVDEFQDTDPLQFEILRTVYAVEYRLPLFLVGDPKQAIYSFRNADLHTYLAARGEASSEATLADNQRASEALIQATNALFGANERAFMLDGLAYPAVGFGDKPRKAFVDRSASRDAAPMQAWMLPTDAEGGRSSFAGEPQLKRPEAFAASAQATAAEIARLIDAGQRGEITQGGAPLRAGDIAVLVRSHAQGSRMREALARLGVGSVELSQASVYRSSDAEDLERLLAAIADPTRERLLRAALATVWLGLDAAAIDALASDEAALLAHVQRLAQARETWLARGAGFMLRGLLRSLGIAARLLARPDGERRLTNALHLIECLHQASHAHPAPEALLRWLQTQRASGGDADEATQLRLESDRNLVQIVTIHKAKGLEYAVVFCPFVWDGYRRPANGALEGVEYHDADGRRVIDYRKGLDAAFDEKSVAAQRRIESAAEDLRLIYVALTRAVHRCVIVAGGYLSGGKASPAESTRSLLAWLVAGQGQTPQQWFDGKRTSAAIAAAWQALAARCGPALQLAPLPMAPGVPVRADRPAPESLAALAAPESIAPGWWIGSFSALAQGATHELSAIDHDTLVAPAAPFPAPAASAPDAGATPPADDDVLRFARGAAAGDCIHALFERIDFGAPAGWPQAVADALRLHAPALPAAAGPQAAALRERMLLRMLGDVLQTELPVGTARPLRLADVTPGRRLAELEFHLPSHALDADRLNAALAALGQPVPRLAFRPLRGYLKGFIDLVLEHDGRYFVLDWKSNHLGDSPADYAAAGVEAAMAAHGYHLQALLYCVALHRMLRCRLPDYDPARHFGGAIYLFVRGVRPAWIDPLGAPAGVHFARPTPQALARASALFDAEPV
jgi:exodeoxyribonuclease V beta subunit